MATVAAVDIGTNSVKITVGRREDDGTVTTLFDDTRITRLGKNVDASGKLDPEAVKRTLEALTEFGQQAKTHGAERIAAVGTSALRDATNGAEFVAEAERVLGGTVEVISGDREAQLVYFSGRKDPLISRRIAEAGADILATMDSGGGSTEFVLGQADAILFRDSLQIGAVRLTERAGFSDPPTQEQLAKAAELADEILAAVPLPEGSRFLVASGGTVANLAGMEIAAINPEEPIDATILHGTQLTHEQVKARIQALAAVPLEERRKIPGLEPDRADVIIAGAIIQAQAMSRLGVTAVLASARGLRYGLLYELLESG
jgi:exopolyphosphatase / guanosine-5'-triphosphate,3'-diphosphate pyrophosphatase